MNDPEALRAELSRMSPREVAAVWFCCAVVAYARGQSDLARSFLDSALVFGLTTSQRKALYARGNRFD